MATTKELVSRLGGAIGSHYRNDTNQLFFVEYAGRISRLDLIRPAAAVVSSGTTVLRGTFSFNFDNGVQGGLSTPGVDVFWQQHTSVRRSMDPRNGAELAVVGTASFGSITPAVLQSLPYSSAPLNGNNNATN